MVDFVTLTCPSCGGKLQVSNDIERFACSYCGTESVVKRGGGLVALTPVLESLGKVQGGVDKTASELAIRRFREDIADLEKKLEYAKQKRNHRSEFGIALVIFCGFIFVSFLFTGVNIFVTIFIFLIILGGLYWMVHERKISDEEKIILREIDDKKSQIQRHEKIVA